MVTSKKKKKKKNISHPQNNPVGFMTMSDKPGSAATENG